MERDQRREWLEKAIARWEKPILHLCFAYLGDTALAEDAVQETFLKAWKHYDRFRGEAEEKTWLMRIAMNTCKDQLKSGWFRNTDRSVTPDLLPESVPSLVTNITLAISTIMGYTAMSGAVGGGGLGKLALAYGYQRYRYAVLYLAVIVLVLITQIIQSFGTWLAARLDKRLKNK